MDTLTELETEFLEQLAGVHAAAAERRLDPGRKAAREAAALLSSMRMEARGAKPADAATLRTKLAAHEAALVDANRALDEAASAALLGGGGGGGARAAAAAGGAGAPAPASEAARARASANTDKMAAGTASLQAARARLEETTAIAEGTLGALQEQRETLASIQARTAQVSAAADEANSITRRMSSFWGGLFGGGK